VLLALLASACEGGLLDPRDARAPRDVSASYSWVETGWEETVRPVGRPSIVVTWSLPELWNGEVFRVYTRRSDRGAYALAATVTSCGGTLCRYTDLNVQPGERYDYFVAAYREGRSEEAPSTAVVGVTVPLFQRPATPTGLMAQGLDGAAWLRWERGPGVARYRVFLKREGTSDRFIEIGETDGNSFLDTRARNGERFGYQIAAVDTLGHVSLQSALATAIPRPDYHTELIYSMADSLQASGFRFIGSATESPVLSGQSPSAQWRVESSAGVLRIRPLGQSARTAGEFTTALTCGPGSDADCVSVRTAPDAAAFGTAPVVADAGRTYVFRLRGADGRTNYGKIRVQGRTTDSAGRAILLFDWAYQLIPDERSLQRGG
jgi:hypothetical protein